MISYGESHQQIIRCGARSLPHQQTRNRIAIYDIDSLWEVRRPLRMQEIFPTSNSPIDYPEADLADANILTFGINVALGGVLSRPILSIDACSRYTAILRVQPRSGDKCAKITLNYLRDLQILLLISYIDVPTNLADVEPKHAGSLDVLAKFTIAGKFNVSFVGSRQAKEMKTQCCSTGSQNLGKSKRAQRNSFL